MRMKIPVFVWMVFFMVTLLFLYAAKGGIKGIVVDKDKNPLEGVKITITSVKYPLTKFTLETNEKGEFIQIGLEPDYYQVLCEKEGFVPKSEQIRVHINEITDTTMKLSSLQEQIEVKVIPGKEEAQKAYRFYQEGKYEEALAEYNAALEKNPEEISNYYNLGVTYMALGKNEEAIEAFQKTIEFDPENFLALKFLGQLYARENDTPQAEIYLVQAAGLSPNDPELFFNLGVLRMNAANYPAAIEAFQKAIDCDEEYVDAYYQLGLLYINQNKAEKASAVFQKFLEFSLDDPRASNVRKILEMIGKKN